jgi:Uma2 family endonuclease
MTAVPALIEPLVSHAEYLQLLEDSDVRLEYINGAIRMMTGANRKHGLVCARAIVALDNRLRGGRCVVSDAQTRVRIAARNADYFPDVTVYCHRDLETDPIAIQFPSLVVEVLSPSTRSQDRTEKAYAYQSIESLRYYLILDPETDTADLWSRSSGIWSRDVAVLDLADLGISIPVAELFDTA